VPRTLPANVQNAVSTSDYRACLAVEVGTATPIRVNNSPVAVTIGSDSYPPGFLVLGATTYDDQPAISVRISNGSNEVTSQDLDGTANGGVIGKTLTVYEVVFDSTGAQLTADVLYSGVVASLVADAASAELVGTLAELCSAGMVGLISSRLCSYRYGGARCGDTDGTSCDHTFLGCQGHSNTARFGGFRTMPTLLSRLQYYLTEWVPGAATFGTSVAPTTPTPATSTGSVPRLKLKAGTPSGTASVPRKHLSRG
jgi:hypothetical protein